jgi:hypothetical protein
MSTTVDASKENIGIAFALVFGAGSATAIGASVVFIPTLVQYANRKTLASSLGISAGVMMYVSFVEIFQKSRLAFIDSGIETNLAYTYATCCFFAGVLVMMVRVCVGVCVFQFNLFCSSILVVLASSWFIIGGWCCGIGRGEGDITKMITCRRIRRKRYFSFDTLSLYFYTCSHCSCYFLPFSHHQII